MTNQILSCVNHIFSDIQPALGFFSFLSIRLVYKLQLWKEKQASLRKVVSDVNNDYCPYVDFVVNKDKHKYHVYIYKHSESGFAGYIDTKDNYIKNSTGGFVWGSKKDIYDTLMGLGYTLHL